MDVPVKNVDNFEALSSNNIKLETEDDTTEETLCLFLPHHPTEYDNTSDFESESLQVKEEPLSDGYDKATDPLAIEGTELIKSEYHKIKNEVESEILNDDVSSELNLSMRTDDLQINDLHTVKIEEEIEFHPGQVTIDEGTIEGSTRRNCITCTGCINNSVYDGSIKKMSSECKCVYVDVTIENVVEGVSSENKLPVQKGKKLACEYCNERFRCKCYLKRHNNIHIKERKNSNVCQKSFNRKDVLERHLNIHTKGKNYVCNVCQKSFYQSSNLKSHLNIHTKEKNFVCNVCQKSFNRKDVLERHLNIHTKEKNYVCNVCQKSFYQSSHLKSHLNIHTKEKNYTCKLCQKSFNRKDILKRHFNIHTKEKNYVCNFCQKSFNDNGNLLKHLNIHTKEKNYFCNFCQKSFYQSSHLKSHLNIHTKEKNYVCNVCQKSFNRKDILKEHLNIHTKEKN